MNLYFIEKSTTVGLLGGVVNENPATAAGDGDFIPDVFTVSPR